MTVSQDHAQPITAVNIGQTHTPGPWDVDDGDLSIYATDELGGVIPLFQPHEDCDGETMSLAEALDNARLAAAAPDLLEALQWVMSAHGEQLHDAFDAAHRAITKATGEQSGSAGTDAARQLREAL